MHFILKVNDHPVLAEAYHQWKNNHERFDQQLTFIKKQAENLHAESVASDKAFWEDVVKPYLKEKELLPTEYKESENYLEIDKKSRQLFMHDKDDMSTHPLMALLNGLRRGPPNE